MDPIVTIVLESPDPGHDGERVAVQTQFLYSQRHTEAAAKSIDTLRKQLGATMANQPTKPKTKWI